ISETEADELKRHEGNTSPPWFYNSEHMIPLFAAYDKRISELEQENKAQKARVDATKIELKKVIEENNQLHSQLEEELEKKLLEAQRITDAGYRSHAHDSEEW